MQKLSWAPHRYEIMYCVYHIFPAFLWILDVKLFVNVSANAGLWIILWRENLPHHVGSKISFRCQLKISLQVFDEMFFECVCNCQGGIPVPEADLVCKPSPYWNICAIKTRLCLSFDLDGLLLVFEGEKNSSFF